MKFSGKGIIDCICSFLSHNNSVIKIIYIFIIIFAVSAPAFSSITSYDYQSTFNELFSTKDSNSVKYSFLSNETSISDGGVTNDENYLNHVFTFNLRGEQISWIASVAEGLINKYLHKSSKYMTTYKTNLSWESKSESDEKVLGLDYKYVELNTDNFKKNQHYLHFIFGMDHKSNTFRDKSIIRLGFGISYHCDKKESFTEYYENGVVNPDYGYYHFLGYGCFPFKAPACYLKISLTINMFSAVPEDA